MHDLPNDFRMTELGQLPEGWVWATVERIQKNVEKVKSKNNNPDDEFLYIDIGCLDKNKIAKWKKYTWGNAPSRAQQIIKTGDVLFSTVRTYLKNIALVKDSILNHQICSSGFTVIRGFPNLSSSNYLYYYVITDHFIQSLNKLQTGTSYPAIKDRDIFTQPLPLPPLPEQHQIVEIIEEKFSNLDSGIADLKRARDQLKIYRQAVLKSAFEGKLTEEWRNEHTDELEPAEILLERIREEREKHYRERLEEWQQEVREWEENGGQGRKPGKPKEPREMPPLTKKEVEELGELPEGWGWVKLGNMVSEPRYGSSRKCTYENISTGVIRIPNISDGLVDQSDMKFAEFSDEELNTYKIIAGDILTIRSNGSISLVGKSALVTVKDENLIFAGYLIRIRPYQKVLISKYLLHSLSSLALRSQIEMKAKSTSGVNNINSGELKNLIIPTCPLPEQDQIVQEIETRLPVADKLEQTIEEALQKAEALRQSILKHAFQGKLTGEWRKLHPELITGENSAEALLERIRQEKEEQKKKIVAARDGRRTTARGRGKGRGSRTKEGANATGGKQTEGRQETLGEWN